MSTAIIVVDFLRWRARPPSRFFYVTLLFYVLQIGARPSLAASAARRLVCGMPRDGDGIHQHHTAAPPFLSIRARQSLRKVVFFALCILVCVVWWMRCYVSAGQSLALFTPQQQSSRSPIHDRPIDTHTTHSTTTFPAHMHVCMR